MYIGFILLILFVGVIWAIGIYNRYVSLDNDNLEAFSNIGVFSQKRLDLITNLVETVKGYSKHESETLEKVINARSKMVSIDMKNIKNISEIQEAESELNKTLKSLFALSESYPDLKANTNFLELQHNLEDIETELERARRYYNATAKNLNIFVRKFPAILLSKILNFRNADLFKEEETAKSAPKVSF